MARRPSDDDPRVTDLRRYRREREKAARQPPRPRETFLGANPRARLILVATVLAMALLWAAPHIPWTAWRG